MKEIPLTGPNGEGKFALVDDEDYPVASAYSWHYSQGYVVSNRGLRLHHLILGDPLAGFVVDHKDGDGFNNQRTNLRWATHTQNMHNRAPNKKSTSRFKGVHWKSKQQLWVAEIRFNKTKIHLGYFASEIDAARAYNAAAIECFGEYARPNIVPDDAVEPLRYRQATPFSRGRTSQYRGVRLSTDKRWLAEIGVEYRKIHIGSFDTEEAAARAYDAAAKLHHGDRAFLNFP